MVKQQKNIRQRIEDGEFSQSAEISASYLDEDILIIDNINNPQRITVNTHDREFVEDIHVPQQITGYEYQFLACRDSLAEGLLEPREMPHAETLYIMQLMDGFRKKWGVHYPYDD